MPALRWEECQQIAAYQPIRAPFTRDHFICMLSLLAYPCEENIENFQETVGSAYLRLGLIKTEAHLELWKESMEPCPSWTYVPPNPTEGRTNGAWVHIGARRNYQNLKEAGEIQKILSLLD